MNAKIFLFFAACFSILSFYHCEVVSPACLAPPPNIDFVILDKNNNEILTKSNKDSLKIAYLNGLNKQFVSNLLIHVEDSTVQTFSSFRSVVNAYAMVSKSLALQDPVFSLEFGEKVIGKIQLKTFKHNEKCNGWDDISELRFNDKVIQRVANTGIFILKIE